MRRHVETTTTRIQTPSASITPSTTERLLGAEIHHDMRWRNHILESDNSMVKSLNKRLGAQVKIQRTAFFQTRKMIGTGIFMSKLIYLMPLWAGCEDYLVTALQVIQNKAARSITRLSFFTPTKTVLKTCQWMSVRQLMTYHSLVLLYKTLKHKTPEYLYHRVTAGGKFPYKTRQAATCPEGFSFEIQHPVDSGSVRQVTGNKLDLSKNGWCWRSVEMFNTIPDHIRLETNLVNFKKKLKVWVDLNVSI